MGKIQVLSFDLANLIAAGEVVDRPASAIKEMMENAIDAGATHITVEIQNGGVAYMRVTDDGCGMTPEDMRIAIRRHATSKIASANDLDGISTLGFRGEALAAIAAVSDLRLISRVKDAPCGAIMEVDRGEIMALTERICAVGTTVIAENLFVNIPARRKFLKRDATETLAVSATVEKIALSHPEIAVRLISDGTVKLETAGDGQLRSVVWTVYGKEFAERLIFVDNTHAGVRVHGVIGRSDNAKASRNAQNFFINRRYVKSKTATAALEQAYVSYIAPEKYPVCVLYLEMRPDRVDVNVHPAKLEVKFADERPIFEAIYYTVRQALESNTEHPSLSTGRRGGESSFAPSAGNAFVPIENGADRNNRAKQLTFMTGEGNGADPLPQEHWTTEQYLQLYVWKLTEKSPQVRRDYEMGKYPLSFEPQQNIGARAGAGTDASAGASTGASTDAGKNASTGTRKDTSIDEIAPGLSSGGNYFGPLPRFVRGPKSSSSMPFLREQPITVDLPDLDSRAKDYPFEDMTSSVGGETAKPAQPAQPVEQEQQAQAQQTQQTQPEQTQQTQPEKPTRVWKRIFISDDGHLYLPDEHLDAENALPQTLQTQPAQPAQTQTLQPQQAQPEQPEQTQTLQPQQAQPEQPVEQEQPQPEKPEKPKKSTGVWKGVSGVCLPAEFFDVEDDEPSTSEYRLPPLNRSPRKPLVLDGPRAFLPEGFFDVEDEPSTPEYRLIGEVFHSYLLVEQDERLLLIDQHAAHERLIFERLNRARKKHDGSGQTLLVPLEVMLTTDEVQTLENYRADVEALGFRFTSSRNTLSVSVIPLGMTSEAASDLLTVVATRLAEGTGDAALTQDILFEKALYQASCKAAIKAGRVYPPEYAKQIVDELMRLPDITVCPHGRPVMMEITKQKMDKEFGRT